MIYVLIGFGVSAVLAVGVWITSIGVRQRRLGQADVERRKNDVISAIERAVGGSGTKPIDRPRRRTIVSQAGFPTLSKWLLGLVWLPFIASLVVWIASGYSGSAPLATERTTTVSSMTTSHLPTAVSSTTATVTPTTKTPVTTTVVTFNPVRAYADAATINTLEGLSGDNLAKYTQDADAQFKAALTQSKFDQVYSQISGQLGTFESAAFLSTEELQGYTVVHYKAIYSKQTIGVRMVFDQDHLVAGQFFEALP